MTTPFSDLCHFQDKILVLSVLPHVQPENDLPTAKRRRRTKRQSEEHIRFLDAIAILISANVDNGQDTATTYFRSPSHIEILWTLGGNATRPDQRQMIRQVNDYLEEIRDQLFGPDNLLGTFQYIVHECKPRILCYFQEILRCVARASSSSAQLETPDPKEIMDWKQELQMLLRETYYFVEDGSWSDSLRDIHTANYDLFVEKVSNIDKDTDCGELVDLLIYCFFLIKDFGKTAPISPKLRESLEAPANIWAACKDLCQYIAFARRKHGLLWVEFEQVSTNVSHRRTLQ